MGPAAGRDDVFFFPFSSAGGVGVLVALFPGGDGGEGGGVGMAVWEAAETGDRSTRKPLCLQ